MDEEGPRSKRQKTDKTGRFAALEKFKQLKGSKHKYEISDVDNVYEEVNEKEYSKRVYERQTEDWIVDDDGSGYVEDGRDIFDDDLDSESVANSSRGQKSAKKKRLSKLSTTGTGNIQAMLSNMPEKKKPVVNLEEDDLLTEILGSINEEKKPKETPKKSLSYLDEEKVAAKEYMKNLIGPKPIKTNLKTKITKQKPKERRESPTPIKTPEKEPDEINIEINNTKNNTEINTENNTEEILIQNEETELNDYIMEDDFHDDFEMENINEMENAPENIQNKTDITEEQLISGWETTVENVTENIEPETAILTDELPTILNTENQQVFRFFWWDAYEDYYKQPGVVFLFGKVYVESAKSYASCCVAVRNIERKIYLLPRSFQVKEDLKTETDIPVKMVDVYNEFNNKISEQLKIKNFRSRKVVRKYAFDREIPVQSDYLEVRYSATYDNIDPNCQGQTFSKVFGAQTSFLEILLLDRKIKGPCWLDIVNPTLAKSKYSYCKFELNCNSVSDLGIPQDMLSIQPPPLTVLSLNIRTVLNPNTKLNEIVMIGCLVYSKYSVGKKPPKVPFESHFCVFTKPPDRSFPLDLYTELQKYTATKVQKCDSEKALLNYFINQFEKIDPDLIIGHDLMDYYFGLISSRIESTKFNNWSRLGKLKRNKRPTRHRDIKDLMVGHLVCDLKISAKELIRLRSYDLDTLFEEVLNLKNERLSNEDVDKMFVNSAGILKLVSLTMEDAFNITKIVYDLNAIPLALQITNIAGNVMSKTLLGGRSERNEFLLLHAFTEKDYIPPDKTYTKKKEEKESTSNRKKPTYSGGLVLDPKIGFYDTFILLMDFNSLYPSIIQEYNICFTTISSDINIENEMPDTGNDPGILPTEIRKLVESRREVKKLMANPDLSPEIQMQYNIRQMALKLTANSMYGCLGFSNSRFYAKHLASLVTSKGREILMNTKDIVQGMSLDVIYGDTDSIMINTNTTDYEQVIKVGQNVKKTVNKNYKQLELEIDGVFKYMLLLKKKKYAAVTMNKGKTGAINLKKEYKGLDIVRRDWCPLAAEIGKVILDHILSDQTHDERIENIETNLNKVANDLKNDKIPHTLLIITKQLSKDPKQYNEKNILPHVNVALRYNEQGRKPLLQGDTVPYIICEDNTDQPAPKRAYHVEELKKSETLKVDVKYYLSMQIHPVVSRLCEPLDGLDSVQIANMLGLDPTLYKSNAVVPEKIKQITKEVKNEFLNVDQLTFKCFRCHEINIIKPPTANNISLSKCINDNCNAKPYNFVNHILNALQIHLRSLSDKYYNGKLICEDPMCPNATTRIPVRFVEAYPVCNMCKKGLMYSQFTEKDVYTQLRYLKYIFDLDNIDKKLPLDPKIIEAYKILKEKANKYMLQCGYSEVDLTTIFINHSENDWANISNEEIDEIEGETL